MGNMPRDKGVTIQGILRKINDLEEHVWRLRGKAVKHRDVELLELAGELEARLDEIFAAVAELQEPQGAEGA